MKNPIKHPVLRKFMGMLLLGTAGWIIVSESKGFLLEFLGLDRTGLYLVAIAFIFIAFTALGDWFKY